MCEKAHYSVCSCSPSIQARPWKELQGLLEELWGEMTPTLQYVCEKFAPQLNTSVAGIIEVIAVLIDRHSVICRDCHNQTYLIKAR